MTCRSIYMFSGSRLYLRLYVVRSYYIIDLINMLHFTNYTATLTPVHELIDVNHSTVTVITLIITSLYIIPLQHKNLLKNTLQLKNQKKKIEIKKSFTFPVFWVKFPPFSHFLGFQVHVGTMYNQLQLIHHPQNSDLLYQGAELRVHFNIGCQWSVSRETVRIKHSAQLSGWRINHSRLYMNMNSWRSILCRCVRFRTFKYQ